MMRVWFVRWALIFENIVSCVLGAERAAAKTEFDFALYFSGAPKADPEVELAKLKTQLLAGVENRISVSQRWVKTEDYAPPSPDAFRYLAVDLKPEEGVQISKSERVLVMTFSASSEHLMEANLRANRIVLQLAELTAGYPWDEEVRLLYSREAWKAKRVDSWQGLIPDVRAHVNLHAYRDPDLMRVITLGMRKFGQSDLVMSQVPVSDARSAGNLLNACAQRILEGQLPGEGQWSLNLSEIRHEAMKQVAMSNPEKGATGKVVLEFKPVAPEEGDPENRILQLDFPGLKGKTPTERMIRAFSLVYGISDKVSMSKQNDEAMQQASTRAKKVFAEKLVGFRKGFAVNERVLVKAPFVSESRKEYMWVEVTRIEEHAIVGVLQNNSFYDSTLKAGRQVTVPMADVYDYLHVKPDGTEEGNETGKILEKREEP